MCLLQNYITKKKIKGKNSNRIQDWAGLSRFGSEVMLLGAFSWHGLGPLVLLVESSPTSLHNVINHMIKHFSPDGSSCRMTMPPIHRSQRVTERLKECENDVNHMLWPSQWPDPKPLEHSDNKGSCDWLKTSLENHFFKTVELKGALSNPTNSTSCTKHPLGQKNGHSEK